MPDFFLKSSHRIARPTNRKALVGANIVPLPEQKGSLFYVVEIAGRPSEAREHILQIIEHHANDFPHLVSGAVNIPRRFEQLLHALNQDLAQTVGNNHALSITDLHAVIGVEHNKQLFLCGVGSIVTLFMHRTARQRYAIYELDKQFHDAPPTWETAFVTVLDGEINQGDILYAATRLNPREIDIGPLQDILVTLPPTGALKRIEQHLFTDSVFAGVVYKSNESEQIGIEKKKINPVASMEQLGKTKEETASLLGEQAPDIQKTLLTWLGPILKNLSAPGTSGYKAALKNILRNSLKALTHIVATVIALIQNITSSIKSKGNSSDRKVSKTEERVPVHESIKNRFSRIPKSAKLVGVGLLATIVLLIGSISLTNANKQKTQNREEVDRIIQRIEENKNAAEAALIYKDTSQATKLINEAIALLETIPANEKDTTEEVERLKQDLERVSQVARGVIAPKITELGTIDATIGNFRDIILINQTIYGITDAKTVVMYNELNQTLERYETTNGTFGIPVHTAPETSSFLILDEHKQLARADINTRTINPITSGTNALQSIDAIETYGGNLYALSNAGNQIIRMRPQGTSFDAGTPWVVSSDIPLTNGRDLAIDGDVYLLTDASVRKFRSGLEQTFALAPIEPRLGDPIDLWTNTESDYLYILDRNPGRILVFTKEGALVAQYMDEQLNNAISMAIREDRKTIIVVTENKLLQFPADHLLQ